MLLGYFWHIPIAVSLSVVALCLAISIVASIYGARRNETPRI
jgi:hypothetical protein